MATTKAGRVGKGRAVLEALESRLLLDAAAGTGLDDPQVLLATADLFEPDNSAAAAKPITTHGAPQTHSFHTATDEDWVTFSLAESTMVDILTDGTFGYGDTEMWLYGPDNPSWEIAYDDEDGDTPGFSRIQAPLAPGDYWVKVSEYFGDLVDAYTLSVTTVEFTPDAYEPDDSAAAATLIATDGTPQTHSFHTATDEDWAAFSLTEPAFVEILTDGTAGDTELWLYGPDDPFSEFAYDDDGGDMPGFSRIGEFLAPGDYWIKVSEWYGDLVDAYTLTVTASLGVDLAGVEGAAVPDEHLHPGDTVQLSWTVINDGPAATAPSGWSWDWVDDVYFSTADHLDGSEQYLGMWEAAGLTLSPGQTYQGELDVTLPEDIAAADTAYLLVVVDANGDQWDPDRSNNVLAVPIELDPMVRIVTPIWGRFTDNNRTAGMEIAWVDVNPAYAATIGLALDDDGDPLNGAGHVWLAQGLAEDPDGAGDSIELDLPELTPREAPYYLWAAMTDPEGTYTSVPVPIRVFEHAEIADDLLGDQVGGSEYEIHGLEAGQLGDRIYYRVRTNWDPTDNGGDVYLNVGGDFSAGGGVVSGIAVTDHDCTDAEPVTAPDLYGNAVFGLGVVVSDIPASIQDWVEQAVGWSAADISSPPAVAWDYQIEGYFDTRHLAEWDHEPIQISWSMYCGNDDVAGFFITPTFRVFATAPHPGGVLGDSSRAVVVQFNKAADAATVTPAGFALADVGPDGVFGTGDDISVPIESVAYDPATLTATIVPVGNLVMRHAYGIRAIGTGGAPLRDAFGNALDGEYNGRMPSGDAVHGGDYVATFQVEKGGDATCNGVVDVSDLSLLAGNYRGKGGWGQGDFNGNGVVDVSDLSILAGNYRYGTGGQTPPAMPGAGSPADATTGRDAVSETAEAAIVDLLARSADATAHSSAVGSSAPLSSSAGGANGQLDPAGVVAGADVLLVALAAEPPGEQASPVSAAWGARVLTAAANEPASLDLLEVASLSPLPEA